MKENMPNLTVKEDEKYIYIEGYNFHVLFDKIKAQICKWSYEGMDIIRKGPKLNFWRAPIDNDMYVVKEWRKKDIHLLHRRIDNVEIILDDKLVIVKADTFLSPPNGDWGMECEYIYSIYGSGDMQISTKGNPKGKLPESFPRIGLLIMLIMGLEVIVVGQNHCLSIDLYQGNLNLT